jgi:beta-galactosidase
MIEIVDTDGNVIPNSDIIISFEINGNGKIAGVGNGNPTDLTSFQQPRKSTWQGRCLAIVQPAGEAGKIVLTAKAEGLQECSLEIVAE